MVSQAEMVLLFLFVSFGNCQLQNYLLLRVGGSGKLEFRVNWFLKKEDSFLHGGLFSKTCSMAI
jgi:hypothetical protein